VPVLTDVHDDPRWRIGRVVDVLQTPAFLCRQLHFSVNTASSGQACQTQEGPFPLAVGDGKNFRDKPAPPARGDPGVERGFSFGYTTW